MAHKTKISGTTYDIIGGKTKINGTAYDIIGGKTKIDGTAYDIPFITLEQSFPALMTTANLITIGGRNNSSTGTPYITLSTAGTYYVFSFSNGSSSYNKVVFDGSTWTKTVLAGDSNGISKNSSYPKRVYYGSSVFGATIAAFTFEEYTENKIDAIIQGVTIRSLGGRNSSTSAATALTGYSPPFYLFVYSSSNLAYNYVAANYTVENIFSTSGTSLLYIDGTRISYSTSGTAGTAAYGLGYTEAY